MSISERDKLFVRQRSDYACEYCGVSEQNAGGELTVDHFHPQSKNGGGELDNLVYCCSRCNLYKGDFGLIRPTRRSYGIRAAIQLNCTSGKEKTVIYLH